MEIRIAQVHPRPFLWEPLLQLLQLLSRILYKLCKQI